MVSSVKDFVLGNPPERRDQGQRDYVEVIDLVTPPSPEPQQQQQEHPEPQQQQQEHPEPQQQQQEHPEPQQQPYPEPRQQQPHPQSSQQQPHPEPRQQQPHPEPRQQQPHPEPRQQQPHPESRQQQPHPEPRPRQQHPARSEPRQQPRPQIRVRTDLRQRILNLNSRLMERNHDNPSHLDATTNSLVDILRWSLESGQLSERQETEGEVKREVPEEHPGAPEQPSTAWHPQETIPRDRLFLHAVRRLGGLFNGLEEYPSAPPGGGQGTARPREGEAVDVSLDQPAGGERGARASAAGVPVPGLEDLINLQTLPTLVDPAAGWAEQVAVDVLRRWMRVLRDTLTYLTFFFARANIAQQTHLAPSVWQEMHQRFSQLLRLDNYSMRDYLERQGASQKASTETASTQKASTQTASTQKASTQTASTQQTSQRRRRAAFPLGSDPSECFVCVEREPTVALDPCKHFLCSICVKYRNRCPICNHRITSSSKLRQK